MKSELLTRAVSEVIPGDLAKKKLESGKPLRIYLGIDPTGAKLHLGHSVPLRKLKAFQDAGHHVIFLVGSFTAMIGDPSGRNTMREPLTKEQVEKNFQTYKQQAGKILDFSKIELRYNHEWLEKLKIDDLLRLMSHFTVQQMLQRDMFKERMKKGEDLSPTEFLYPMMQGYDSVMLDVDAEVGGNDQLFNMLCGRTLLKEIKKKEKFVLTTKLIEGTDGRKMSKTYDNCIFLDDEPNDMYGKILSIKDELILPYMECCTDMPMDEIKEVEKAMKKGNPKDFKMRLAKEIVSLYHGAKPSEAAEAEFEHVHKEKGVPDDAPEIPSNSSRLIVDVLVEKGIIASKSEARRLVEQKGIQLDGKPISMEQKLVPGVVKVGKRRFLKIKKK